MAQFRTRIQLNRGRHGIGLRKLTAISEEAEKFFRMFGEDVQLGNGDWLADNFENGSLSFDIGYIGQVPDAAVITSNKAFYHITAPDLNPDDLGYGIRKATLLQYAKMASHIEVDDAIAFGIYTNGDKSPAEYRELSKKHSLELERLIKQEVAHYGSVQGVITTFYKEANPPMFYMRSLSTGERIKCIFPVSMYNNVWQFLKSKEAILFVDGWITTVADGKIDHLRVESISEAPEYRPGDLDKFFGCDPDYTGKLTTEEYIREIRDEDE